MLNALEPQTTL